MKLPEQRIKIMGVVMARSGSKGVKSKNLLRIGEETLIERSVRIASNSEWLTDLVFSTDDAHYAKLARGAGEVEVVMRPRELSDDTASSWDVARHALLNIERNGSKKIDIIALLQPTTPFRTVKHIGLAVEKIIKHGFSAAMTVREISYPVEWMFWIDSDENATPVIDQKFTVKRRQEARTTYQPAGTVYAVTRERLFSEAPMSRNDLAYVCVPYKEAVNIDTMDDYIIAKAFFNETD